MGELSADSAFMTAYFLGYVCIDQFFLQGEYLFSLFCGNMMVAHGRGSFVKRWLRISCLIFYEVCQERIYLFSPSGRLYGSLNDQELVLPPYKNMKPTTWGFFNNVAGVDPQV